MNAFNIIYGKEGATKYPPKFERITAGFGRRKKYVVSMRNLQFYLKHGMILDNIHRMLEYRQRAFLYKFVDNMTDMRRKATSNFERGLWKLMVLFLKILKKFFKFKEFF